MNNLSKEEREKLVIKIRNNVAKYKNKIENKKIKEIKDSFINLFIMCESSYKIILKKYLQNKNKYRSDEDMKLNISQINASLGYATFNIENDLINKLFSTAGIYNKEGTRSAKILRNNISHTLDTSYIDEVVKRQKELFDDMNKFLKLLTK